MRERFASGRVRQGFDDVVRAGRGGVDGDDSQGGCGVLVDAGELEGRGIAGGCGWLCDVAGVVGRRVIEC